MVNKVQSILTKLRYLIPVSHLRKLTHFNLVLNNLRVGARQFHFQQILCFAALLFKAAYWRHSVSMPSSAQNARTENLLYTLICLDSVKKTSKRCYKPGRGAVLFHTVVDLHSLIGSWVASNANILHHVDFECSFPKFQGNKVDVFSTIKMQSVQCMKCSRDTQLASATHSASAMSFKSNHHEKLQCSEWMYVDTRFVLPPPNISFSKQSLKKRYAVCRRDVQGHNVCTPSGEYTQASYFCRRGRLLGP